MAGVRVSQAQRALIDHFRDLLRHNDPIGWDQLLACDGAAGESFFELGREMNIYAAEGLSQAAIDALNRLIADGEAYFDAASPSVYTLDASYARRPLAREWRRYEDDDPHWAPLILRRGPPPIRSGWKL